MKIRVLAGTFLLAAVLVLSSFTNNFVEARSGAPVKVGQAYKVLVGVGALSFKVLEIGKDGMVKVQAVDDGKFVGIKRGSVWWLNLNQALLVEAKKKLLSHS